MLSLLSAASDDVVDVSKLSGQLQLLYEGSAPDLARCQKSEGMTANRTAVPRPAVKNPFFELSDSKMAELSTMVAQQPNSLAALA
jgi:hypothetical protein